MLKIIKYIETKTKMSAIRKRTIFQYGVKFINVAHNGNKKCEFAFMRMANVVILFFRCKKTSKMRIKIMINM